VTQLSAWQGFLSSSVQIMRSRVREGAKEGEDTRRKINIVIFFAKFASCSRLREHFIVD
jgi:hypothetical protein